MIANCKAVSAADCTSSSHQVQVVNIEETRKIKCNENQTQAKKKKKKGKSD